MTSELIPAYILISPGPKDPAHAGISIEVIKSFYDKKPILGVCLGMQCINEAFGGRTVRAPVPVHGKTSIIHHSSQGIFESVPSSFSAARYHSLMILSENPKLVTTAWTGKGVIMGVQVEGHPVFGVQFHPESFLTEYGEIIIKNFLKTGKVAGSL